MKPDLAAPTSCTTSPAGTWLAVLLLPVVVLAGVLPFLGASTIGNDYPLYAISHQMELQLALWNGEFALYVPGFAGGQSASALTLGQLYHPLSHLAAAMPGYWDGHALDWNTALRLLSLAGAHAAALWVLTHWGVRTWFAFGLAAALVYNLRMLDLFRYGAALEAWTGLLFACAAAVACHSYPHRLLPNVLFTLATAWLVLSGHPQMVYIAGLGAMMFIAVLPIYTVAINEPAHAPRQAWPRFYATMALWGLLGVALAAAYLLPFYFDFMSQSSTRTVQAYAWADGFRDSFVGTVDNFARPLRADVHGAFGATSLWSIAALAVPVAWLYRRRQPIAVWLLLGLALLLFLLVQGGRTPLHAWTWHWLPFADSFRVAGRYSMLLPGVLVLLLVWWQQRAGRRAVRATLGLATGFWLLYPAALMIWPEVPAEHAPIALRSVPLAVEVLIWCLGLVSLVTLGIAVVYYKGRLAQIVFCAAVVLQIGLVLNHGTWLETRSPTPTVEQLLEHKRDRLRYLRVTGNGLYDDTVRELLERSFLEPDFVRLYREATPVVSRAQAFAQLARGRAPDQVLLEMPAGAPAPSAARPWQPHEAVRVVHASFNRLALEVSAADTRHVVLSYPYRRNWVISVDGQEVKPVAANGGQLAFTVPKGNTTAELRYHSWAATAGMWGSTAALVVLMGLSAFRVAGTGGGWHMPLLMAIIAAGAVLATWTWQGRLHAGGHLMSAYQWVPPLTAASPNAAFSKPSSVSSLYQPNRPEWFNAGRGVDGNKAPETGFMTDLERRPMWRVALGVPTDIAAVTLYESRIDAQLNVRPLLVAVSDDGTRWRTIATLDERPSTSPDGHRHRLDVEPPARGRFLAVFGNGNNADSLSQLTLDEIEVEAAAQ